MAFLQFAHILWETSKPTMILTDNKSVTQFFQTKAFPTSLWNACDYMLQFNFKIAHIAGSVNTAADFLSRLELKVTEKIHLKILEDVQTTPRTILLHASRRPIWNWRTDDITKRAISEKGSRMGSRPGTINTEAKYQRIHKHRRKHYVVFHQRN